jgi:hypothetical protein
MTKLLSNFKGRQLVSSQDMYWIRIPMVKKLDCWPVTFCTCPHLERKKWCRNCCLFTYKTVAYLFDHIIDSVLQKKKKNFYFI